MIQREQSIWLLLATLTLIGMLFFPLATKNINDITYSVYTSGIQEQLSSTPEMKIKKEISIVPLSLNIAAILFSFASIFLFKNRSLQKKVILIGILIIIALTVLCGINFQQLPGGFTGIAMATGTLSPLVAIGFSRLAIRGIRKDEQLLRSADRLR